jgi:hypothetical protein
MKMEYMQREILHVRELIEQHNRLTEGLFEQYKELTLRQLNKAEISVDKRLDGMNEFRAQLQDMIRLFATIEKMEAIRAEFYLRFDAVTKEMDELKLWRSNVQGRYSIVLLLWPLLVGILFFLLSHYYK